MADRRLLSVGTLRWALEATGHSIPEVARRTAALARAYGHTSRERRLDPVGLHHRLDRAEAGGLTLFTPREIAWLAAVLDLAPGDLAPDRAQFDLDAADLAPLDRSP